MKSDEDVPDVLRELWRQRSRQLASNVANGSREHREIAHAAALIQQDYNGRFLVELLQNANDQALRGDVHDSTIIVVRSGGLLAVSNGGQVLTAQNLERLSSLAGSDKSGLLVGIRESGSRPSIKLPIRPSYTAPPRAIREHRGMS